MKYFLVSSFCNYFTINCFVNNMRLFSSFLIFNFSFLSLPFVYIISLTFKEQVHERINDFLITLFEILNFLFKTYFKDFFGLVHFKLFLIYEYSFNFIVFILSWYFLLLNLLLKQFSQLFQIFKIQRTITENIIFFKDKQIK
jgi:hypothetical protein